MNDQSAIVSSGICICNRTGLFGGKDFIICCQSTPCGSFSLLFNKMATKVLLLNRLALVCAFFLLPFFLAENTILETATASKAPDFTLRNVRTNETVSLSSYRGKVVLLDFWATWCQSCEFTIPTLQQVDSSFSSKDFQLISVDVQWEMGESDHVVRKFISEKGMDWLVVKDTADSSTTTAYGVKVIPMLFIIDLSGGIQRSYQDPAITAKELEEQISVILKDERLIPGEIFLASILLGGLGAGIIIKVILKAKMKILRADELANFDDQL